MTLPVPCMVVPIGGMGDAMPALCEHSDPPREEGPENHGVVPRIGEGVKPWNCGKPRLKKP